MYFPEILLQPFIHIWRPQVFNTRRELFSKVEISNMNMMYNVLLGGNGPLTSVYETDNTCTHCCLNKLSDVCLYELL